MLLPLILIAAGTAASLVVASRFSWPVRGDRPDFRPDVEHSHEQPLDTTPETTGFHTLDRMPGELKKASALAKVPLGLLVGWIAKESGGLLARHPQPGPGDTTLDERGYFQLLPEESRVLHLQHERLSVDPRYSINGGLALIGRYMGIVDRFGIATRGSSYYWKLVKLLHSMGPGQTARIVHRAKAAGKVTSWDVLSTFALGLKVHGAQPKKWFPFIDDVFAIGKWFGFGDDTRVIAGLDNAPVELPYADIPDPLDVITPRTDSPRTVL